MLALLVCMVACDSVERTTAVPEELSNQVYWSLQLNHHAITLAKENPWNTMQLVAVPLTYEQKALSTEGATISYVSSDTNTVSVTADGTVRAKKETGSSQVSVIVRLTLDGITHADTAFIKVQNTTAPKTLQSFSIQPGPGQSAKVDPDDQLGILFISQFLNRPAQDGKQMTELIVYYRSLDPHITTVDRATGQVLNTYSRKVGVARIVASVYAYGVTFSDTLLLTVVQPVVAALSFYERIHTSGQGMELFLESGANRTIGTGGIIIMANATFQSPEVRFEDTTGILRDPAGCAGPSLDLLFPPYQPENLFVCTEYLFFTQPGTYRYREVQSGLSGVITVIDESLPLP